MFFWHRRPKYKNEVGELLAGDFYMMVLPDEDPFPPEEVTVHSYDGDGYRCGRIPYPAEGFGGPVYCVDPDAKTVWEMVPNFGHSEIVDLLDDYVGLQHFRNENLTNIALYTLEEC